MRTQKANNLTVFVVTIGESTEKKCYRAILKQILKPEKIIFIRNVKGMHRAFNKIHKMAKTDFFCRVDADMILDPDCLEALYAEIIKDSKIYDSRAFLKDPFLGKIGHIHLHRTALVKSYVFKNELACDIGLEKYCLKKGYKHVVVNRVLGIHHPVYKFEDLKDKLTREGRIITKFKFYDNFRRDFLNLLNLVNKGNSQALIALAYLFKGLLSNKNLEEKDYTKISKAEIKREYQLFKNLKLDNFIKKESFYKRVVDFIDKARRLF